MFKQITKAFILVFSLFWVVCLCIDYIDKHPNHVDAFYHFKYFNLLLVLQLVGLGLFVIVQFINVERIKSKFYAGLSFLCFLSFICVAVLFSFDSHIGEQISISQLGYFLSRLFSFYLIILLILCSAFVLGQEVLKRFFDKGNSFSLCMAFGLMVFIMLMMILAMVHQLKQLPLAVLIIVPILVFYKRSLFFIKTTLFTPFKDYSKINYWGYLAYFLIVVGLGINLISILSPYPYGFDARNYYVNLTQLIAENHSLVEGFQPYNWQILMSSGFVLVESHEVSILLSFTSFILAMVALNELASKIFKLKINYRILLICTLVVTPAIYNQLSIDVKIDFALLFFQIVIVHQFLKYVKDGHASLKSIILLGLLSGFALGIKFTHLYLVATLVISFWTLRSGVIGLFTSSVIGIGVFLLAKIDDVGGLRSAHLGVYFQQWVLLGLGLILLIYFFMSKRQVLLRMISFTLLFAAFTAVPIFPWVVKNYVETKSLSPNTLLLGKAPGYKTNFKELDRIYKLNINN